MTHSSTYRVMIFNPHDNVLYCEVQARDVYEEILTDWETLQSAGPYAALEYCDMIDEIATRVPDKRYGVPVYFEGITQPVEYITAKKGK